VVRVFFFSRGANLPGPMSGIAAEIPAATVTRPWWLSRRIVLPIVFALFAVRFVLCAGSGLGDDEAYYWTWSRTLEWSYFEHPGMVAWPIHLSTLLLGHHALAVRLPTLLWSIATSVVLFRWVRRMFPDDEELAWGSLLLLNVVPLMSVGAVFVAPDAPFAFFWILTLSLAWRALSEDPRWWYAAGLTGGLGLISKYNMVLFPPTILAFLLATGTWRTQLKRLEAWFGGFLMTLFFLPVLLWNADHGWASFVFHLHDRHHGKSQPFTHAGQFLATQFGLVSPVLFVAMLAAVVWAWRKRDPRWTFLVCASTFIVIFFAVLSPVGDFKPHWPAVGYVTGAIIAAAWLRDVASVRLSKWAVGVAAGMTIAMYSIAFIPLGSLVESLTDRFRPDLTPVVVKADLTNDLYGWPLAAAKAREIATTMDHPFVFAHMYQNASEIAFYGPDLEVTRLGSRHDEFEIQRDDEKLRGRDAIFVARSTFFQDPTGKYPFDSCEPAGQQPIERAGRVVRTFSFWRCRNYHP